jgi:predicted  nucleic acid-binding Zn-ribbon protein
MQDESLLALVLKDLEQLQPAASDLEAHDEEIRLEMLASFLRRIDYSLIEGYAAVSSAEAKGYNEALTDLQNGLDDFKPTAKALEALLREARLKGRIAQLKMMKGDDAGGMWFPDPGTQTINDRIAELEKARASAGKGTDG